MSTAPTPSTHATTASAQATYGKARRGTASESGGDMFANLLALLSSTLQPAADTAAALEPTDPLKAQDPAPDGSQNPLANLLGWNATPALPSAPAAGKASDNGANISCVETTTAPGLSNATDTASLATTTLPALMSASTALPALMSTAATSAPALQVAAGATTAAAQPLGGLQGMTPLASPTAPDAQTLLALSRATGSGAVEATGAEPTRNGTVTADPATGTPSVNATPGGDASPAVPRGLQWRSAAGSTTAAHTAGVSHAAGAGHAPMAETAQIARQVLAAQSRSTVALDERFGQSMANQAPLASDNSIPLAAGARGAPQQDSGSGTHGGAPGQGGLEATAPENTVASNPEASAYAEATRELEDPGAAHWGTSQLRQASLRVGEAGEDAIDIQLSMTGQEVQVDFRTDNADARASLAQDASGSLGELLQRGGIQLGNVSVGAQNQQQGEPGRESAPAPAQTRGRSAKDNETAVSTTPAPRPRSDGSRPLDLFV